MPISLVLLVSSCLKDDVNETIVLLGTESEVQPIEEVIPDTLLKFLMKPDVLETPLPVGNTPPDIQGEYLFGPRELFGYNWFSPEANDSLYIRFGGTADTLLVPSDTLTFHVSDTIIQDGDTLVTQHDSIVVTNNMSLYYPDGQHNRLVSCDILEKGFSRKSVKNAYVMGEGEGAQFTVYFTVEYDDCVEPVSGAAFTLTRGYIITGTITEYGIANAIVASINIDAQFNYLPSGIPEDALERLKNNIFVYRVKTDDPNPFGTAKRQKWYN